MTDARSGRAPARPDPGCACWASSRSPWRTHRTDAGTRIAGSTTTRSPLPDARGGPSRAPPRPCDSTTKSRSPTASMELRVTPSKPSSAATASRSMANPAPASAPEPSGETLARRAASANRPRSRSSISTYASRWCANRTGWAGWTWVWPGMTTCSLTAGEVHQRPLQVQEAAVEVSRSGGAATAAGPWPPGRCATARCAACRPRHRRAPRAPSPG